MFKEYVRYLKDNPEGHWFKRKIFGWGWTPASWQGWLTVFVFALVILWMGLSLAANPNPTNTDLLWFFVELLIIIFVLIFISNKKGQKPHWKWGFTEEEWEKYRDKK